MKKNTFWVAALGLLTAGVAQAQSSVTLYGLVDEGIMLNTNNKVMVNGRNVGGRQWSLDSQSATQGSRWGLKGSEDLGGGLKAIFTLEAGFNLSTGAIAQGGTFFGRQAFVGLASNQFGTVTLGRQYDVENDLVAPYGFPLAYGGPISEHPGDLDNINHTFRLNNSVKYLSPLFNGLQFETMASLGGVAGNISQQSSYMGAINYSYGPLGVAASYELFKNPSATGGLLNDNATAASFNSLNAGYLAANPASSQQVIAGSARYAIGPVVAGLVYTNTKYNNIGAYGGRNAIFNDIEVNAKYQISPAVFVAGAYNYTKGNAVVNNVGNQKINQFSAIADYAVSKRTDFYVLGSFQQVSGTGSTGAAAVADIGGLGDSSNNHQAVIRVAIHHKF